ncbi:MAG: hypothetical protein KAH11_03035, partial [Rhodospirillales bacterium]|nr:hypothetical protein [Rhodospirillales bacterium]
MPLISDTDAWKNLNELRDQMLGVPLADLFDADHARASGCAIDLGGLYVDFSRQRVSAEVLVGMGALAETADASGFIERMARRETVNLSEDRPALHMQVRRTPGDGADERLKAFAERVRVGDIPSASGAPFTAVLAIGIGGSELGPALVLDALGDAYGGAMDVRMCANIDGTAFRRATDGLDPATTLVIVISKSFRTMETQANAERAAIWMQGAVGGDWAKNFCAVSANVEEAGKFGIGEDRVFAMASGVGGRFSLWSAVGLPVALAFGWDVFQQLRTGAAEMDAHALSAPTRQNAPMMLALLTVWNASFLGYGAEACV